MRDGRGRDLSASSGPPSFALTGRVALVTGGGRGLGLSMAHGLAAAGARVILNGRDTARLAAALEALGDEGFAAEPLAFDMTDEAAVAGAMKAIADRFGGLDILINNAAIRDRRPLDGIDQASARQVMESNLVGPMTVSRQAFALLRQSRHPRVINVTSIAGHIARAGDAAYTASKAGLTGFTRALAAEWGPHGITVNAIAPGYFATEANRAMVDDPSIKAWLGQRTSLGRWGEPAEIAGAAVFLASDAASFITGHTLAVDGGFLTHW